MVIIMPKVERMAAGQFKTRCLQLMEDVQREKKQIIITKRGKPVAKLVPVDEQSQSLFGYMQGSITSVGNIIDPVEADWEANA